MTRSVPTAQRQFIAGSAIGGVIAFAVFAAILTLTGGHPSLLRHDVFGNFFDAQAHSLLHGRWDVPAKELSFEGFQLGHKTYMIFGIWPSLLRMPILLVAPSLYGRLTQLSMLTAFAVFVGALSALHWQIRELVRPGRPCRRIEPAIVIVGLSCGSAMVLLANRAIVYEEVLLWGIALSLLAYGRIVALIDSPSPRRLGLACLCAVLALLARASVGLGPVAALGLVATGQVVGTLANGRAPRFVARLDWLGVGATAPARPVRWVGSCVTCALLPVVAYAGVNYARFRSLFGVPWTKYRIVSFNRSYQLVLAKNSNTVFGLQYVRTTLLQYVRPDALHFDPMFPWVTFPHFRASVVGGVKLIERTMSTSLTASMPALVLLGVVGALVCIRPAFARGRTVVALRAPLLGSIVGIIPTIAIAMVADRYLGDFMPIVVLAALAGLHTLLRWREDAGTRKTANAFLVVVAVLMIFGIWVNVSLALVYQRLADPLTLQQRTEMVAFQYGVDRHFGGRPRDVEFVPKLPPRPAPAFTSAVVGACNAMYWSDGQRWWEIEGRPATGVFRLRVSFPAHLGREWQPILVTGPGGLLEVGVRGSGREVQVGLAQVGIDGVLHWFSGSIFGPSRTADMEIVVSRPRRRISVLIGGSDVLDLPIYRLYVAPYRLGSASEPRVAPRFAGTVTLRPPDLGLCRELLRREHGG